MLCDYYDCIINSVMAYMSLGGNTQNGKSEKKSHNTIFINFRVILGPMTKTETD